jgi:hypothetical protein
LASKLQDGHFSFYFPSLLKVKSLEWLKFLFKIIFILWAGRMVQVAECLPSKCEALNSNPKTTKKLFHFIFGVTGV